mmetsp:Transcript_58896/g.156809  ORF Transcript_58896/g.156809 Transcript_58896/m.156809 type:complete len:225 (-) Transcript_58896:213-887(-)
MADAIAVFLLPSPHSLQKLFSTQIVARQLFVLEEATLDHTLRRDASVIRTRNPKCHVATHPVPPRERVLDGASQRVTQVQAACDIGWWNHHDEPLGLHRVESFLCVRSKVPLFFPPSTPCGLHCLRFVLFLHRTRYVLLVALGRLWDNYRRDLLHNCRLSVLLLTRPWFTPLRFLLHHLCFLGSLLVLLCIGCRNSICCRNCRWRPWCGHSGWRNRLRRSRNHL